MFENNRPTCPKCGGGTRQAFATTPEYVSCRRCGGVFTNADHTSPNPCAAHPAYAADYCPVCGTARKIGA